MFFGQLSFFKAQTLLVEFSKKDRRTPVPEPQSAFLSYLLLFFSYLFFTGPRFKN